MNMKYTKRLLPSLLLLVCAGAAAALPPLYVDPQSSAAIWAGNNPSDGRVTDIRNRIANQPGARWFGGWSGEIGAAVGHFVGTAW